jgi:DNA-binding NtrC family response regulator
MIGTTTHEHTTTTLGDEADLVGVSPSMQRVLSTMQRLEGVDAPMVLITGESGTGKDLIAKAVHERGPRKDKPFLKVDCASKSEDMIERELFGQEGAGVDKPGLFELADSGTVFLDEIASLSASMQQKVLKVLETRRYKRVGGQADMTLEAAIIAATTKNLRDEVRNGAFREDLFFRLNVVPVEIPPLKKRNEDLEPLAAQLLEQAARELGKPAPKLADDARQALARYPWPGNVRELKNVLERVVMLKSNDGPVHAQDLPAEIRIATMTGEGAVATEGCPFELPAGGVDLEAVERGLLAQALHRTNGNQSAAARLLGISRYALRYRMEKFKLH